MSQKVFFDYDPLAGATEEFEYDESTDTAIVHRTADVAPTIEWNKEKANDGSNGWVSPAHEMAHVARIPIEVQYIWMTKYGVDVMNKNHWGGVKRLLNSNEWRYLRVNSMIIWRAPKTG